MAKLLLCATKKVTLAVGLGGLCFGINLMAELAEQQVGGFAVAAFSGWLKFITVLFGSPKLMLNFLVTLVMATMTLAWTWDRSEPP